ncbi:hydroxyacid dehydrogenase [Kineococcus esterisolvens]|uniref:hydroxyacid dehydrogenase n=1 Tax=unclassified Kineococcus TaxID=2621656 RepID=UPI003D7E15E1
MNRLCGAIALGDPGLVGDLFDAAALRRLHACVDLAPGVVSAVDDPRSRRALGAAEVLLTGWGAPVLDAGVLASARRLRVVVHTGGSVKRLAPAAVWERGVRVSSSASVNARPVAEYALAVVLLAGKRVLESSRAYAQHRSLTAWSARAPFGNNGLVVGVVGASRTGRRLLELLRPFDVEPLLHDPWVTPQEARDLGAEATGLHDLLARADVVSLHAPALPETHHLIGAPELALMRDGTTIVNTARGSLIDTRALVPEVLSGRLDAVLDVTDPEPLPPDHPLFDAPGVLLTPHVAGSLGNELRRLGTCAVEEVERFVRTGELAHEVHEADLHRTA